MNIIHRACFNSFRSVVHSCIYCYVDKIVYKEVSSIIYREINRVCSDGDIIEQNLKG